jgi:hypothetical protein
MNERQKESEEEIFSEIISLIENSKTDEDIEKTIKEYSSFLTQSSNNNITNSQNFNENNIYNKLTKVLKDNENKLKNLVLEDSDLIIKLFCCVKDIGENLAKNKRGIDAITNQTIM